MKLRYIALIVLFVSFSCRTYVPSIVVFETGIHHGSGTIGAGNSRSVIVNELLRPYLSLSEDELYKLPEVQILDPTSQVVGWEENFINRPDKSVFLFKPGDYRNWGTMHISRSGTEDAYRLFVYYNPRLVDPFSPVHPVEQHDSESVGIKRFRLSRTDYCLISNLIFEPGESKEEDLNINVLAAKADHNIVNRCLMQGSDRSALHIQFSDYNIVQNCVIRNTVQRPGADNVGILIYGEKSESNYNRILNNEIYNCTQGIQLEYRPAYGPLGFCSGTVIENNDIYITPDLYRIKGDDTLACAELGIVLKIGGRNSIDSNIVKVINNRVWGFRQTDLSCSGSGGTQGVGIQLTDFADNVIVQDNKVFDLSMGIKITTKNPETFKTKLSNIAILNNLIFDIRKRASVDNPVGIFASGSADIMYNTVSNSMEGIQFDDASKLELRRRVQCNNFLNIDKAIYVGSRTNNDLRLNVVRMRDHGKQVESSSRRVGSTLYVDKTKSSKFEDYTFTIKQWTNPTKVRVKEVLPVDGFDFSKTHFQEQCDCTADGNGDRWWSPMYFGTHSVKYKN